MNQEFIHNTAYHCENGAAVNILTNNGIPLTEAMLFGIGSGLYYGYVPFKKYNGAPMVAFRPYPGNIFKNACKHLEIDFERKKFNNEQAAQIYLDQKLEEGHICGLQANAKFLTYFPMPYRVDFNAHNMVVYGKEGNDYLASDSVMPVIGKVPTEDLNKARFTPGTLAPSGLIYYPKHIPKVINWDAAIKSGIKKTCSDIVSWMPYMGIKGMRVVAKNISKWPKTDGVDKANFYLDQLIRFQEIMGTGGAGFRFIYSTFLAEASEKINNPKLKEMADEMQTIAETWVAFALSASRVTRKRVKGPTIYRDLTNKLNHIADLEQHFFTRLSKMI